jgi:hypothetical protein
LAKHSRAYRVPISIAPHAHRTKIFRAYSVGVRHSKDLPAATVPAFAAQLLAPSRINSSVN